MTLGPFPVDDSTLDVLEHALGSTYIEGEDGPIVVGADMSVPQLLDFLSGYDATKLTPALNQYDQPLHDVQEYPEPIYTRDCVIRALLAEVRRLRVGAP